jgi:hypothetical protein
VNRKEMEEEFIKLINNKNNNISKSNPKTQRYEFPSKKINLGLYYQKHSLDLINKIRDLFIEFDVDKSNTFDQYEFYEMFNINKIPIKMEEIIYLFKFNSRKKSITFSELIHLTFNPDFDKRYKEVIEKIKPRCETGIICPEDFSGMLSHLCEFGKLSSDTKKFRKKISKSKESLILNYLKTKSKFGIDKDDIIQNKDDKVPLTFRLSNKKVDNSSKSIYNRNNSTNIISLSLTDSELSKKIKEFNSENYYIVNTFKTILEISHKKLKRNEKVFERNNYRNKLDISKRNLYNSIDILHKINPKINNTYISYCPLKEKFMDINTGRLYDAAADIKEYKYKNLKVNETGNLLNYKPILTDIKKNKERNYYSFFSKKLLKK